MARVSISAVSVQVELRAVRTVDVKPHGFEMGPVLFHGSKDDMEWIRLELAEAFDLLVPEELEKAKATAATVAS